MRPPASAWPAVALLAALPLLAGCGQPGPPLPPSANLAQPVRDLSAQRLGPQIELTWTPPSKTTDGTVIHGPLAVSICIWPGAVPMRPAPPPHALMPLIAGAPPPTIETSTGPKPPPPPPPTPVMVPVCAAPQPLLPASRATPAAATMALADYATAVEAAGGKPASLAVAFNNAKGENAGWSNLVQVSLAPVAPPPGQLSAASTVDGVRLTWQSPAPQPALLRVYRESPAAPAPARSGLTGVQLPLPHPPRKAAGPQATIIATIAGDTTSYLDESTQFGQVYRYWLRSADGAEPTAAESADSNITTVQPRDIFPPPVPTGVEALLGVGQGNQIELSWQGVEASRLAGYNVYRRIAGGDWQQRNQTTVLTPVFADSAAGLPPGTELEYAVTSLGRNGAESDKSPPAAIRLPPPE